jgi:hypothetical protein
LSRLGALKVHDRFADLVSVQFERLVIEAGSNTFTLPLHPRLTVIAGLGQLERESLIGELVGALGSSRSGVHAELVEDGGRHLAVFRPEGGRHRVVDIDAARDVSDEFADSEGRIDLLQHHGVPLRTARRKMRFTPADLASESHGSVLVREMAEKDQMTLWAAAAELQRSNDELQQVADTVGSAPEDAEIVDRVEQHHRRLEAAQERQERNRKRTFFISFLSTLSAIPAGIFFPLAAFGLLAIAVLAVVLSVWFRRSVKRASKAEDKALADAGAQSYLGFQIQRVNGLLSSEAHRRALSAAAEAYRNAVAAWRTVAGDTQVEWALEHREEIAATAQVRKNMDALGALSSTHPAHASNDSSELARVVVARLAELRNLCGSGECFPLVLDEPFVDLEPSMKPALLEVLNHAIDAPQLIFLTEDEHVASWARLEALTGTLAIIEPQPEAAEQPAPPARKRDHITS